MLFVGLDWAETRHRVVILSAAGAEVYRGWIEHSACGLDVFADLLRGWKRRWNLHVAIELHDSLLLDRLLQLGVAVYGLNPRSAERARERFTPAGLKDDDRDAWCLAEFVRTSYQHLRPLRPDSDVTRALHEWVTLREDLTQERTTQLQRLRSHLVRWHPQALAAVGDGLNCAWALALLEQYPTADALAGLTAAQVTRGSCGRHLRGATRQRVAEAAHGPSPTCIPARNPAHAAEVRHGVTLIRELNGRLAEVDAALAELVAAHPDAFIFQSLPNCGPTTTAALLAGFGDDRQRWSGADEVAARWGVAPITIQSGKHRTVHRRRACDTTLHQTWVWYAFNTVRKKGCWARDDYQAKRKAGGQHYTVLRAIADDWTRIAYRCWQDHVPYDEALHRKNRAQHATPRMAK
jgi:transposase